MESYLKKVLCVVCRGPVATAVHPLQCAGKHTGASLRGQCGIRMGAARRPNLPLAGSEPSQEFVTKQTSVQDVCML